VYANGDSIDVICDNSGIIELRQASTPDNPQSNFQKVYAKSDDKLYILNDAGTETVVGTQTSDYRLKKDFTILKSPLQKILNLDAYSFNYRDEIAWKKTMPKKIRTRNDNKKRESSGLIAQQLEQFIPEAVHTSPNGIKSVNYDLIVPYLIEAIKEQQKQIEDLQKQINELK